jgi:hypothetical protein
MIPEGLMPQQQLRVVTAANPDRAVTSNRHAPVRASSRNAQHRNIHEIDGDLNEIEKITRNARRGRSAARAAVDDRRSTRRAVAGIPAHHSPHDCRRPTSRQADWARGSHPGVNWFVANR